MSMLSFGMSQLRLAKRQVVYWRRDLVNNIRYGTKAPNHLELIFVDPLDVKRLIPWSVGNRMGLNQSGRVVEGLDWDVYTQTVAESGNVNWLIAHWVDGVPWEEVGSYKYVLKEVERRPLEGCCTRQDVVDRYRRLDDMFEDAKRTGRLKTRREIDPTALREEGGVIMHIGPDGEPIFGGSGVHRFTVARILNIPLPCVVGSVDRSALDQYPKFRTRPSVI